MYEMNLKIGRDCEQAASENHQEKGNQMNTPTFHEVLLGKHYGI
jgi:hypothetical protein